jgi:hypothetical protein
MTALEQAETNLIDARQALRAGLAYVEYVKKGLPKSGARRRLLPFLRAPSPSSDFRAALTTGVESLTKPLDEGDLRLLAALLAVADLAAQERKAEFDLKVAQVPCAQRGDDVNQDMKRSA